MAKVLRIKSGTSIKIRRTNGRTQPAIISTVSRDLKSVTVEWYEEGMTRGKEIDIQTVYALNNHLLPPRTKTVSYDMAPRLKRCRTKSSISCFTNIQTSEAQRRRFAPDLIAYASEAEFEQCTAEPSLEQSRPAKKDVVKEIEKLKRNREERRLRHAEIREEKEALMNIDPGNPNWEFLAMIRDYQATLEYKSFPETEPADCHQITVCVRKRPLNKKEMDKKIVDVVSIPKKDTIIVHEPKTKVDLTKYLDNQQFRFDFAFNETCSNETVYKYTAKPLVHSIFEGGMATCFAYGQTGSGKTHTMGGNFTGKSQDCKKGIYAMAARDVFKLLYSPEHKDKDLEVTSSFFEIYNGKVFDLLGNKTRLRVLEDGKQQVRVVGLTERAVTNVNEVLALIQAGNTARTSGHTSVNTNSSRSHAVFQIILRYAKNKDLCGKFSLIDLAGNERGKDTSSSNRLTRTEGAEINKSLLALKECIRALGRKGCHLPFRASKLTMVLKDSFIGEKSKTCMIAMISPGMTSCEHSLNTLRYADRVKELVAGEEPVQDIPQIEGANQLDDLKSLSKEEISEEVYNPIEAISKLQLQEEEIMDSLKTWTENSCKWAALEEGLLATSRVVDYDQDAFASELDNLLDVRMKSLTLLREKVSLFRELLRTEEEISTRITEPGKSNND